MTKTTMTERPFELYEQVKIEGENGYYWVVGYGQDGSVSLWGGSKDPNGYRQNRAVMPEDLKVDTRNIQRKSVPGFIYDRSE